MWMARRRSSYPNRRYDRGFGLARRRRDVVALFLTRARTATLQTKPPACARAERRRHSCAVAGSLARAEASTRECSHLVATFKVLTNRSQSRIRAVSQPTFWRGVMFRVEVDGCLGLVNLSTFSDATVSRSDRLTAKSRGVANSARSVWWGCDLKNAKSNVRPRRFPKSNAMRWTAPASRARAYDLD
jgi:hypothetical protein